MSCLLYTSVVITYYNTIFVTSHVLSFLHILKSWASGIVSSLEEGRIVWNKQILTEHILTES